MISATPPSPTTTAITVEMPIASRSSSAASNTTSPGSSPEISEPSTAPVCVSPVASSRYDRPGSSTPRTTATVHERGGR